jgi:acetyl esterase/lipase
VRLDRKAGRNSRRNPGRRPDFAAPIYGATWEDVRVLQNAPPLSLALASDDEFGEIMIQSSLRLYSAWQAAGCSVELHAYANGGHGFGMRQRGLSSDHWIEHSHEWLEARGLVKASRLGAARATEVQS